MLKRTVNIARNHEEARQWDIQQAVTMTPEERQEIAKTLRIKVYGTDSPDIRDYHRKRSDT